LDRGAIPRVDPFSFTWGGQPWVPIEWLAEVLMAAGHRLAGYSGIAALVTAALIALHALIYFNAVRFVAPGFAAAALVLVDLVLIPMMLARPHLLAWVLIALWTWIMLRARERDRAPPLAAALLVVLWVNLHGSFVIGLVIAGAFGLEALLASADRTKAFRQWAVFGLACLAALFVNANGIEGVLHPLKIANLLMLPLIDEWKPSSPATTPFFFGVVAIGFARAFIRCAGPCSRFLWSWLCCRCATRRFWRSSPRCCSRPASMPIPQGISEGSRCWGRAWQPCCLAPASYFR
jgi:hypothetical protein